MEYSRGTNERERKIVRVSAAGIAANVALAAVKAALGMTTGSIAILSDAVNNLTDSASSIITIVGTKMAGKPPNRNHPFGFGRIEYITSVIIGMILLYTGIQMLISSVKNIAHPEKVDYSIGALIIIAATILIKLLLSRYTKKAGNDLDSGSLRASGADAGNDALISALTLASAAIYMTTGISVDAWAGAAISVFIIKTGCDVFIDMHGHILGQRADEELARAIYSDVRACPLVSGAHDLILHDYGPDRMTGSINIEVDHELTAGEMYPVLYKLQMSLFREHMTYIVFGICAVETDHEEYQAVKEALEEIYASDPHILGYHGIDADESLKTIFCDIILDFDCDPAAARLNVTNALRKKFPGYSVYVNIDSEFA